jgi:hypothetical protein
VVSNFGQITGDVVRDDPSSLSIFQEGKRITVQVNYPVGKYGRQNNIVDLKLRTGTRSEDQTTKCDTDRGFVSRGTSKCVREIAVFDFSGIRWNSGELVVFSVRGTGAEAVYRIP